MEEKLIETECELRKRQASLGVNLIVTTGIICIIVALLPIFSTAEAEVPNGTCAQIVLSESFTRLILSLSFLFVIGLTGGIILLKSTIKHTAKNFFNSPEE